MRQVVEAYRGLGLTLTPLRGKDAYLQKWNKREYTDREWTEWLAKGTNIGLVLGSRSANIVCIDVDPRNGGLKWYKENQWIADECAIIEESGRGDGGTHLFFSDSAGEFQKKCKPADGIDFLTNGTQTVLAPSIHPDTNKPYTKVKGDLSLYPFTVTELPERMKILLREHGATKRRESQKPFETGRDITEDDRRVLQQDIKKLTAKASRHDTVVGWMINAVAAGMPKPEACGMTDNWFREQGREPQPMESENWYDFAEEKLQSGEASVTNNALVPERFLANEDGDDGFQPVTDPVPEANVHYPWEDGLLMTKHGDYKRTLWTIQTVVENHPELKGRLAFNESTCQPIKYRMEGQEDNFPWDSPAEEYNWRSKFSALDFSQLHFWFSKSKYHLEIAKHDMQMAVTNVARQRVVHPIRDHLLSLKWDGEERLITWLRLVTKCDDTVYNNKMGELMILSMVARIVQPGTKWDNCVILEGRQGNGKSSLCQILAGAPENYCESFIDLKDTKSIVEKMMGILVYELGEMDQYFNSFTSGKLKQFLSIANDTVRMPYAPEAVIVPRSLIFIGTTNKSEYLQDGTGERRYWPVKTGYDFFDLDWLTENRDQLLAEAYQWVKRDGVEESLRIDQDLMKMQVKENFKRQDDDAWSSAIQEYVEKHRDFGPFKTTDILFCALNIDVSRQSRKDMGRVVNILTGLKFVPKRFKDGKTDVLHRGYVSTIDTPKHLQPTIME